MLYSVLATATPHAPPLIHTHTHTLPPLSLSLCLVLSQAINDNARVQFQFSKLVFSAKVATSSLRADKRQGISRTPLLLYSLNTHVVCVCVCLFVYVCVGDIVAHRQLVRQSPCPSLTRSFTALSLCSVEDYNGRVDLRIPFI